MKNQTKVSDYTNIITRIQKREKRNKLLENLMIIGVIIGVIGVFLFFGACAATNNGIYAALAIISFILAIFPLIYYEFKKEFINN